LLSRLNHDAVCASCANRRATSTATWLHGLAPVPADADRHRVGQLLKEYRVAHGLTQADLADRLGFDQSYVSKVESGGREIRDLDALRRIADVLVVAPADLGLSRDGIRNEDVVLDGDAMAAVAASQRGWRLVREHLNHAREQLGVRAAALYDGCSIEGSCGPLLVRSDWLLPEPVDFDQVRCGGP
jgi:transcriptional regulator with XRE-family HTH domain